jgi:DNA-binding CsgD family transcriptional regulator
MDEAYFSEAISLHLNKALPLNNSSILDGLTKSEKKIVHLITENKTSQQIADELNVAIKIIHKHRSNMYLSSN